MSARPAIGPVVAGSWYPADPAALSAEVDRLLSPEPASDEGSTTGDDLLALIEPHAGYMYSGQVAGAGFRLLRGRRVEVCLVLGPSHYEGFRGAAVPRAERYRTPLGDVPFDPRALESLSRAKGFQTSDRPFEREHSLEAEIPFLQRALSPGWALVPVLVGPESDPSDLAEVAEGLAPLVDRGALVVVSSDFTHFGPRFGYVPFRTDVPRKLRELDMDAIRRIEGGDPAAFEAYLEKTEATICGRHAIGVLLRVLDGGSAGSLLAYDTSGRMTGDWDHSVSYAAMAFRAGSVPS